MEKRMFSKTRKSVVLGLTSVIAVSTILSASAASTGKTLSSNFTLVNLVAGTNQGDIQYIDENGNDWREGATPDPGFEDSFTLTGLGDSIQRRQYFDENLPAGSGSVVVSTQGPVGAIVQIQARGQSSTYGAYVGVSEGANEANLPLVMHKRGTASGEANSQIIVQNASGTPIDFTIEFFDGVTGALVAAATETVTGLAVNAAREFDLEEKDTLPANWYGSAVVRAAAGGEVAVVTNLFSGAHAMQTFNAFTSFEKEWGVPLMASRLANGLSTPLVIQNKSGGEIPANTITLSCQGNENVSTAPPGTARNFEIKNATAIVNNAAFFDFNPVVNNGFPTDWSGACTVKSAFDTAMFIQMRVVGDAFASVGNERAGAYEGIPLDGTDTVVVVPQWDRRLANGFSSNVTVMNLSPSATANVTLVYKAAPGFDVDDCSATFDRTIPPNGALRQNHRVPDGVTDSVPEVSENCEGSLTVTSTNDVPIDAFVQLDQLDTISPPVAPLVSGDRFGAHNVFNLP
jgi:hypothetical protein